MAVPTNRSFAAGFNAEVFNQAIYSTMELGLAMNPEDQPVFIWPDEIITQGHGSSNLPFDFNDQSTNVIPGKRLAVVCAVEFVSRMPNGTPMGQFENNLVVLTLLQKQYEETKGALWVLLGGNRYKYNSTAPPFALRDAGVVQVYLQAEDES